MNLEEYEEQKKVCLYIIIIGLIMSLVGTFLVILEANQYSIQVSVTGLLLVAIGLSLDFVIDNFKELQF